MVGHVVPGVHQDSRFDPVDTLIAERNGSQPNRRCRRGSLDQIVVENPVDISSRRQVEPTR